MKSIWLAAKSFIFTTLPAAAAARRPARPSRYHGIALALLLAVGIENAACARVIKIVVPYGPGATLDIVARNFSVELGQALGASVIVENRPGAGGCVGTAAVARTKDNNTLLMTAASHDFSAYLYKNPGYDPIKDFTGVSYVGNSGFVIAVPGSLGVATLQDYIKLLKSKPGALNYSSAGTGGATHLGMASFLAKVGAKMQHIPMKATGDAINEVLANRVQGTVAAVPAIIGFKNDARIKMLAYTGAKRSSLLPDLPTVAEAGVPGYKYDTWLGLLAPASMPKEEVEKIHAAMDKVLAEPAVQKRMVHLGVESEPMSVSNFNKLLKADYIAAGPLVKISGAKIH